MAILNFFGCKHHCIIISEIYIGKSNLVVQQKILVYSYNCDMLALYLTDMINVRFF